MASWHAHISGAAALLELRGSEQFESWLGRKLFLHASHNIIASCVAKQVCVPLALLEVEKQILLDDTKYSLAIRRGRFSRTLAEFRHTKASNSLKERLSLSQKMIGDIDQLMNDMFALDPFEPLDDATISMLSELICPLPTRADRYSSIRWAQAWNALRILQMFICDAVHTSLSTFLAVSSPSNPLTTNENQDILILSLKRLRQSVALKARKCVEGVLRSVPYFVDFSQEPQFTARSLIGPLYAVIVSEFVAVEAKLYAIDR